MNKILNPMCDMPWNIYLDYLADQGFDELREINIYNLVVGETTNCRGITGWWGTEAYGDGGFMADDFDYCIFNGFGCGEVTYNRWQNNKIYSDGDGLGGGMIENFYYGYFNEHGCGT